MKGRGKGIPERDQGCLFKESLPLVEMGEKEVYSLSGFVRRNPSKLYIGNVSFKDHLCSHGFEWVIRLEEYLSKLDWSFLEKKYRPAGRSPLHPQILVSLILYGLMDGVKSLRGLERLSIKDLGAVYLCGGLIPDHSTIGRFLIRHEEELSEIFFERILRDIHIELKLNLEEVSGDGTTIEARASHYRLLKEEAVREKARTAEELAKGSPSDRKLELEACRFKEAEAELQERIDIKKKSGKDSSELRINPVESEAAPQKLKNGAYRPAYKPVILVNKERFIVGQRVEKTCEVKGAGYLLDHYKDCTGVRPKRGLFDAGFHVGEILKIGVEQDIDLLIPSGKAEQGSWSKTGRKGQYVKQDFHYDEKRDVYICPQGRELTFKDHYKDSLGAKIRRYCCHCPSCPKKSRCTDSIKGRNISRYECDELKEAMEMVLSHPLAREKYKKRMGMVEPVFGHLRGQQGLDKFHRFGLKKVRLEFSLHAVAYNLGRAFRVFGMLKVGLYPPPGSKLKPKWLFFIFHINF